MVYRFILLSDEIDKFRREIQISAEATFLDLHDAILNSVGYEKGEMASFFLCNEDWEKNTEITLVDMDTASDVDIFLMEDTRLEELLDEERQKLLYVFDYLTERAFFMELCEIITGKTLSKPLVSLSVGAAPPQQMDFNELEQKTVVKATADLDETFYGDSEYDADELDPDGFIPPETPSEEEIPAE
jgi:uncharacterized protein YciU (UPF0263 family)